MILVAFPHYTCGGLLCDILNDKFSDVDPLNNGIASFSHTFGKIGDSDSVYKNFNHREFYQAIEKLQALDNVCVVGTHCWPGELDLRQFRQVICVTTMTYRSRIYRWARCFYHYYLSSEPWQLNGQDLIDKQRETAKNYLIPFEPVPGAVNIEFSEIVDNSVSFRNLIAEHDAEKSLTRWKQLNDFLYSTEFWSSDPVQRYYEAELETRLSQHYVYQ